MDLTAFIYTDRPSTVRPHSPHQGDPPQGDPRPSISRREDPQADGHERDNKVVLQQDAPVSAHGTVTATSAWRPTRVWLLLYRLGVSAGMGSFYVEEYKKPEYQVTVKPAPNARFRAIKFKPLLKPATSLVSRSQRQGQYVVHTSTHYWWDEDEADDSEAGGEGADASASDESDSTYGAPSSRSTKAFSTPTAASPSRSPRPSIQNIRTRITASKRASPMRPIAKSPVTPPCWPLRLLPSQRRANQLCVQERDRSE